MNRVFITTLVAAISLCMAGSLQATEAKAKKEPSAAQMASRERMSKCSVEWKQAKADGKLAKDAKWPKFWSDCNKRLKGSNV
jgi:hypothetical protein